MWAVFVGTRHRTVAVGSPHPVPALGAGSFVVGRVGEGMAGQGMVGRGAALSREAVVVVVDIPTFSLCEA